MIGSLKYMGVCLSAVLIASCDKDGSAVLPNIFSGNGQSSLKITYTSNADSVFLSWTLEKEVVFDKYEISVSNTSAKTVIGKDANKCILTHIPYNIPVLIKMSLLSGKDTVNSCKLTVKIDGADKYLLSKIIPNQGSVTSGDGMYSVALPDGRSLFLMGDSFVSPVTNGERSRGAHMYRNTYIVYDNGKVSAIYGPNETSAAVPAGVTNEWDHWYWPGDGFVSGNSLYIFQNLMYMGASGMWGFRYEATDLLEYSLPDITLTSATRIPYTGSTGAVFGASALNDGDYIYIYAQKDVRNDLDPISEAWVARTTISSLKSKWEYFDGYAWSENQTDAAKMKGLDGIPVSSQFSVFKLKDKYVLLTDNKSLFVNDIYTVTSDTPYGPWSHRKVIYTVPPFSSSNRMAYNAMAHPQFVKDGMMLVTYDVNTGDSEEQWSDVSSYRPVFLWIGVDDILK